MRFTALCSDTDCDGTTFSAQRVNASATEDVYKQLSNHCVSEVIPEAVFFTRPEFRNLLKWDQDYYRKEGYASLGANWAPWVEDDSIGTYDEPLFNDADIEQANYERGW